MKKLVIIHTTPATIPSLGQLVGNLSQPWQVANLLDDSILPEINQAGAITPGVRARLYTQLAMAQTLKPDAILCACSSIGGVIEEGSSFCSVPVLRIDGPMAEAAVNAGSRIAVLAALPSTLGPTTDLILRKAKAAGKTPEVTSHVVEGAGALLQSGDLEGYDRLVSAEILRQLEENEILLLAQASMARCLPLLPESARRRVLTSPVSGVAQLEKL